MLVVVCLLVYIDREEYFSISGPVYGKVLEFNPAV